jgi:hypothetical protein
MSSPKPRKRKRFKSKAGENRCTWSMRNDDKGAHPLLWVDEAEWRTWPVCPECKRRVRPVSHGEGGKSGRYWRTIHEGCKVSRWLERQSELDFDLDIPPEQMEKIYAQHKARVRWERGQA